VKIKTFQSQSFALKGIMYSERNFSTFARLLGETLPQWKKECFS